MPTATAVRWLAPPHHHDNAPLPRSPHLSLELFPAKSVFGAADRVADLAMSLIKLALGFANSSLDRVHFEVGTQLV